MKKEGFSYSVFLSFSSTNILGSGCVYLRSNHTKYIKSRFKWVSASKLVYFSDPIGRFLFLSINPNHFYTFFRQRDFASQVGVFWFRDISIFVLENKTEILTKQIIFCIRLCLYTIENFHQTFPFASSELFGWSLHDCLVVSPSAFVYSVTVYKDPCCETDCTCLYCTGCNCYRIYWSYCSK